MVRLSKDLSRCLGRGFGLSNLKQMQSFYLAYGGLEKSQTLSGQLDVFDSGKIAKRFPLPWSQYVRLLAVLILIDLKIGTFSHADAGQMHLYLNYAREHWMRNDENPPVGLILCARKNEAIKNGEK